MNIEYYVMVDFTSFSIIAQKLGGIDITISEAEMNEINKNAWQQYKLAYKAGIDESELAETNELLATYGENTHLNGRQTLAFARIRKIDSDFSRAERQRDDVEFAVFAAPGGDHRLAHGGEGGGAHEDLDGLARAEQAVHVVVLRAADQAQRPVLAVFEGQGFRAVLADVDALGEGSDAVVLRAGSRA